MHLVRLEPTTLKLLGTMFTYYGALGKRYNRFVTANTYPTLSQAVCTQIAGAVQLLAGVLKG